MGSITAYESADGRRYRVRYRKPDHSQTDKRGFRTKRDAEEFLHMVELSKVRGSYVDPALSRVTVETWARDWLKSQAQLKPTALVGYESALSKHIIPRWGRRSLSDIGYAEIQHWISDLSKTLAPQTVRNIYAVFSLVFSFAVRDGRLVRNPAEGIQLPRRIKAKRGYLTHAQVHRLADECGDSRTLVLFLAYTGLRWGEAAALRVRDVDFTRRRVEVARRFRTRGADRVRHAQDSRSQVGAVPAVPRRPHRRGLQRSRARRPPLSVAERRRHPRRQLPVPHTRVRGAAGAAGRPELPEGHAARSSPHGGEPCALIGCEHQGDPGHAWARLCDDDPGRLRRPVPRRSRQCRGRAHGAKAASPPARRAGLPTP